MTSISSTLPVYGAPASQTTTEAARTIALVVAAVAVGRMPGEPARILAPGAPLPLLARLIGARPHLPLADPRLEVLRAISASLAMGAATIGDELLAAALRVDWTKGDLRRAFAGIPLQLP